MKPGRWMVLVLIAGLLTAFVFFDLGELFRLERIKAEQEHLVELLHADPVAFTLGFFLTYVVLTAVSVPGAATTLTLVAGALFGLLWGLLLVSFASTLGATLAMVLARWLFRSQVEARFGKLLKTINRGIEQEGAFYLFTMRLVPAIPFFAINLAMGLTRVRVPVYFVVSQIGMLAGTVVYVNAGVELGQVNSFGDILSPSLIASFVLLGVFPLFTKRLLDFLKGRRVYRGYAKPAAFDRDLVVIGAGSAGLVAALIAATVRAKVTLIEKNKMGGDCLNRGCVPSKALIRSARLAYDVSRAAELGFDAGHLPVNFAAVMGRVHGVIKEIAPKDSVARYEGLGVDVEKGFGKIVSPWHVEVNGKTLSTRNILVATGATPFVPPIEKIDSIHYYTSDNLWDLEELPARTVVLGGGPVGTELTQALSRLGSQVTQIELLPRILPGEDEEFSSMVRAQLEVEGVRVLTEHLPKQVADIEGKKMLRCVKKVAEGETRVDVPFDALVLATGRKAQVKGFGLEELGVTLTDGGRVRVDDYLRTNFPNIFAIGDVAGPYQFTHTASHMAWYASVNALFGAFRKFKVDYSVIPRATFCYPEVAGVGLNETEAKAQQVPYEVTTYDVADLDRAITDGQALGLVKVLTVPGSDRILGATIAAEQAGELIAEFTLAMKHRIGLRKVLGTIHVYPTLMEMNKFVAGEWRKANKPEWALRLAGKYHALRRGKAAGA